MFNKVVLQKGVTLYIRKSEQFKTVNFSMRWKAALDESKASYRTVLAKVLQDSTSDYPTQSKLRNKLDDLYGTVLYTDVSKNGDEHILFLNSEFVNDEYLTDATVLDEVLSILQSVVFNPNVTDGRFNDDIINREKRTITERIRSIYNDKTSFAQKRMLEIIRPNTPVATSAYGTEEAVESLTSELLVETYESMLNEDQIDIYIVGDIDENVIIEKVKSLFPFKGREITPIQPTVKPNSDVQKEVKHVNEKQDMKSGKLHLAFNTPILFSNPDHMKMQIANGIFGGFAHSKLFVNVREKESMAYSVNSAYAAHHGLLYVMAGIDPELEEKAVGLIKEQLKAMQQGEITDLELEQTVALFVNSIKSTFDSATGQIDVFDQYKTLDENFTPELLINSWKSVTIEDVQKMMSNIELEIVYLLSGKESE